MYNSNYHIGDYISTIEEELESAYWWYYGEVGQKIVESKKFSNLPLGIKIIDGHQEHEFSNLSPINLGPIGVKNPKHLDIVSYDPEIKEVKSICEVKTTTDKNKKSFKSNGLCSIFMEEAKENGIPIFFAVVRINRLVRRDIVFINGDKVSLNKKVFEEEIEYFYNHSEIEFYNENEFSIREGNFIILT